MSKNSFCCEKCSSPITQGEETKHYKIDYIPTFAPDPFVDIPRVNRAKLFLYCLPCHKQDGDQTEFVRKQKKVVFSPGIEVEKSLSVKRFESIHRERTLKEKLEADWEERLKEKKIR